MVSRRKKKDKKGGGKNHQINGGRQSEKRFFDSPNMLLKILYGLYCMITFFFFFLKGKKRISLTPFLLTSLSLSSYLVPSVVGSAC